MNLIRTKLQYKIFIFDTENMCYTHSPLGRERKRIKVSDFFAY